MLVSGRAGGGNEELQMANHDSLCGNSCSSADLLSIFMVVNIQQTGGVHNPEGHMETHARGTQLYVQSTLS